MEFKGLEDGVLLYIFPGVYIMLLRFRPQGCMFFSELGGCRAVVSPSCSCPLVLTIQTGNRNDLAGTSYIVRCERFFSGFPKEIRLLTVPAIVRSGCSA